MVPIHTTFGYDAHVPVAGFRWVKPKEIGAKRIYREREILPVKHLPGSENPGDMPQGVALPVEVIPKPGSLLIESRAPWDRENTRVWRRPDENPVLFRDFAGLDPSNLASLHQFANQFGFLGIRRWATILPKRDPFSDIETMSEADLQWRSIGFEKYELRVETQTEWAKAIGLMNVAVDVFDLLRKKDTTGIRGFIKWEKDLALSERCRSPREFEVEMNIINFQFRESGNDLHQWHCVRPSAGVREFIFYPSPSKHDDPISVGWFWLVDIVNKQLASGTRPHLELGLVGSDGYPKITERLIPETLLTSMWAQLYRAIASEKNYKRCVCGRWFEISDDVDGHTVRRLYCSPPCRTKVYRNRMAKAVELRASGRTPKQIAIELETDTKTVKAWLAKQG